MEQLTIQSTTAVSSVLDSLNPDNGKSETSLLSGLNDNSSSSGTDRVNLDLSAVYKSLTVLGDEVIKKLNELLGDKVPGGIQSLKPEEHTSEATADRIVQGVTGLFGIFQAQHKDLEGEALMSAFLDTVRGGIKTGYNSAMGSLSDIGALQFDGVKEGIDKTMTLVEQGLQAFADHYLGKDKEPAPTQETTQST